MCSRDSLMGRRKSYGCGPAVFVGLLIRPDVRMVGAEDCDWVTPLQIGTGGTRMRKAGDARPAGVRAHPDPGPGRGAGAGNGHCITN